MKLSENAQKLPTSGVRRMMELARELDDVVHLEVGEPGHATPDHIAEAAREAARQGHTHYSPSTGLPMLRTALAEKVRRVNHVNVPDFSHVVVSTGAAHALYTILSAILEPGTSIVLPNPAWSSFSVMARGVGAEVRYYSVGPENNYLPDPDEIAGLIDESTRAVLLNSPSNPLGSVIPRELAEQLYEVCAQRDVWIVSDECYDQIDFSGNFVSMGSLEDTPTRVISVYSFSKVYAMTGWRVGYAVLPAAAIKPVSAMLQLSLLCSNTLAQYAALEAITGPQNCVETWRGEYLANRNMVLERLAGSEFSAHRPDGGFYVWLRKPDNGLTSGQTAMQLLQERRVALTPGTAFGSNGEGFLRLSLAADQAELERGLDRILA